MQRLKNVLPFMGLEVGTPVALRHRLNYRNGRALTPALLVLDGNGFEATADERHVTVTRQVDGAAAVNVYVEAWHTIEGEFPHRPQPFVVHGGSGGGAAALITDGRSLLGDGTARDPLRVNAAATERTFPTTCQATDLPGMCVSATGVSAAQVARVNPRTAGLVTPAIGVITQKFAPTFCLVMVFGEVAVVPATLIPGRVCWVGVDGYPTSTRPVPAPGERLANQVIGTALGIDRLLGDPERRPVIVTGGRGP